MESDLRTAARMIRSAENIRIVSHIDADGITSAAIAAMTCKRLGKDYDVVFASKLSEDVIANINALYVPSAALLDLLGEEVLQPAARSGYCRVHVHVAWGIPR